MLRWQAVVGIALGVALAAIVMGLITPWRGYTLPPPSGPILTETDGTIRSVVLQYARGSDFVLPVYHAFLTQLPPDLTVYLACPDEAAFEEARTAIGNVPPPIKPILTRHEQTAWSRDRWVALRPGRPHDPVTLLAPRGESGDELWLARLGDNRMAEDLAKALHLAARHSTLYFDGGDFLADGRHVFVTPAVLTRNIQCTVATREALAQAIRQELGREPVLMDDVPDHHAGMFMMAAGPGADGRRVMVVGDPALARGLIAEPRPEGAWPGPYHELPGGPDLGAEMQGRFDAAARHAATAGYRVVRIPVVPSRTGKAYITYVNVLIDRRGADKIVYLPVFRGAEALNAAASKVWLAEGFLVRPVDCTSVFGKGGTLHCLVTPTDRQ